MFIAQADGVCGRAGMQGAGRSIRELQSSINALTAQVHDSLMRPTYPQQAHRRLRRRRPPYSAWLAQPFVKASSQFR